MRPPDEGITPCANVLEQHVEEAAGLYVTRTALVEAPHLTPLFLHRLDNRLAAHLDGITVARDYGLRCCYDALKRPFSPGAVFTASTAIILQRRFDDLDRLVVVASESSAAEQEFIACLGWVDRQYLLGVVSPLLASEDPIRQSIGIAASSQHGIDPGVAHNTSVESMSPRVRGWALRAGGELGRENFLSTCMAHLRDPDLECQFWAARSAVLLGEGGSAIERLSAAVMTPGGLRLPALQLVLQATSVDKAHAFLQSLRSDAVTRRWLIYGSGLVGNPSYVPWLLSQMSDRVYARVAGEAFQNITGLDLLQGFEVPRPEDFESGPSEDPSDDNVKLDPDEGLPWPDVRRVEAWWHANENRFQDGTRCFLGGPVSRERCIGVLKNGYQRQRILAAQYLCLLEPGTPLFNTSAPAWRQQRLLARMQ